MTSINGKPLSLGFKLPQKPATKTKIDSKIDKTADSSNDNGDVSTQSRYTDFMKQILTEGKYNNKYIRGYVRDYYGTFTIYYQDGSTETITEDLRD